MKLNTLILASSVLLLSACASNSLETSAKSDSAETNATTAVLSDAVGALKENFLADYAAKQLGLPKEKATAALGAVFKTAQGNLSAENFSSIGKAIPGLDSYIDKAPDVSSLTGLASSLGGDKAKAGASLGYLDAAFEQIGVPKETVLPLINTVTGYLDQNGMGSAASLLKQGMDFL